MQFLRRHKYILCSLGIYWPALFTLTHIPVPAIASQSGMSDKLMHLLAYLALVFFVWLAISPYEKVRWNRAKVWIVLAVIVWYGATDEWTQGYIGRQVELMDFICDLTGVLLGLGILSALTFWLALLTVQTIFVLVITDLSYLLNLYPHLHLNTAFHLTAYATLTLTWIEHLDRNGRYRKTHPTWPLIAISLPIALLAAVKLTGLYYGKSLWWVDIATAVFGIAITVLASYLTFLTLSKKSSATPDNKAE